MELKQSIAYLGANPTINEIEKYAKADADTIIKELVDYEKKTVEVNGKK